MSDFHSKSQKQVPDTPHTQTNSPEIAPEMPQLTLTQRQVLQLQRTIGNQATMRLLQRQAEIQREDGSAPSAASEPSAAESSSSSSSSSSSAPASSSDGTAMLGSLSDSANIRAPMMRANILSGTGVSATGPISLMGPLVLQDVEMNFGNYESTQPNSAMFKPAK